MRKSRWTVVPGLLFALSAACSDGDESSDKKDDDTEDTESTEDGDEESSGGDASRDAYIAAAIETMTASDSEDFGSAEDNECVAGAMVDVIGLENLQAAATPDEFAGAGDLEALGLEFDGGTWWDKANDCIDMDLWYMTGLAQGDAEAGECLIDATTDEQRRAAFVGALEGVSQDEIDPDVIAAFEAAFTECVETATTTTTAAG